MRNELVRTALVRDVDVERQRLAGTDRADHSCLQLNNSLLRVLRIILQRLLMMTLPQNN